MDHVLPPDEVFNTPPKPLGDTQGAYVIQDYVGLGYSEKEGMLAYYNHHPFPRKGLVYSEGVEANNIIKKIIVLLLKSIVSPRKFLSEFCKLGDYTFRNHYLKRKFYCKFSREIWKLSHLFFRKLGVNDELSYRLGRIAATVFQLEESYRFRLQDIFSCCSVKDLIENPRKEISKLFAIYISRENPSSHSTHAQEEFGKDYVKKDGVGNTFFIASIILRIVLLLPRVKKAWKFSFKEADIDNLKFDQADRWYALSLSDYDFGGITLEERIAEYRDVHNWHQIKLIKQDIIKRTIMSEETPVTPEVTPTPVESPVEPTV